MRIVAEYSFNGGKAAVRKKYPHLFKDVVEAIRIVNSDHHKTKSSKEKTMPGRMLFNPKSLNQAFASFFLARSLSE